VSDAAQFCRPPLTMTTVWPRPDTCLVQLVGEVDIDTAPLLGTYLRTHIAARPTYLLLELSKVTFLAAAGLTVIITAQRNDQDIHGDLRLIGVSSSRAVARVLRISRIDTLVRIHATLADALNTIDKINQN
jgi:anti-sigma B factor antagonist